MPHFSPIRDALLSELFTRADSEILGVKVKSTNSQALIVNLNVYRKHNNLHHLSICTTPDVNIIFIIKRSVELEP